MQNSSAAGKSALMEAVLALVPEEERVQYSAMTGQSLFYMGETDLKHKILAIAEEEGAERASYALKLLQSEGQLTIASTGKDPQTGKLVTHEYHVEGPVMIFLTTTAIEVDEELLNRCIVLTVDEDREQTRAIRPQRESQTLEGLLAKRDANRIRTLHRNAQRLLQPILVANPYARELTFADARTRTRRDHMKYLTLIRAIALLHQHQRERKTIDHNGETVEYIEVTRGDIALADRLAGEVFGRSSDPDLPPQTTRLLSVMRDLVHGECERLSLRCEDVRFTRKQVRELVGWSETHVRNHIDRLVRLEYLAVHHGGVGQRFVYELLVDEEPPQPTTTTATSHTAEGDLAQTSHKPRTRKRTASQSTSHRRKASTDAASPEIAPQTAENAHLDHAPKTKSYRLRRGNGRDHAARSV